MENTVEYNEDKILFLNSVSDIKKKNDGSFIVNYNNMPYHISQSDEMLEKYNWLTEYIEKYPEQAEEYIEKKYIPSADEKVENIRNKRNSLLNEADIMLMKYQEQVSLSIISENSEYYNALLQYKQNLRDITKQLDFPDNVIWPVRPEC
mgnify:FL=1